MSRLFDICASVLGLIILSPFLGAVAIAVRLTSPGPILYRACRAGRNGRPFDLLKFRTMHASLEKGAAITRANDPRVTAIGKTLRAYKIDELPQLINVLRGEMSLVGPRPEDPRYVALYDPEQRQILAALPGITGAASLVYRDEEAILTSEDPERVYVEQLMPRKLSIDLDYERRRTFLSDVLLILKTIRSAVGIRRGSTGLSSSADRSPLE